MKLLLAVQILCLCCSAVAGDKISITLGPEIAVGEDKGNLYQCDLRCHPTDPKVMCVTAKHGHHEKETILFQTEDNGTNWIVTELPKSGDPDVYYDHKGNAHWMFIDKRKGKKLGYRLSKDRGKTWDTTMEPGPAVDHPHIVCDRNPRSKFKGSVYIAGRAFRGGIVVTRSRDGGKTWEHTKLPVKGYDVDTSALPKGVRLFRGGSLAKGFVFAPAVMADGTLLIPVRTSHAFLSRGKRYAGTRSDVYCLRSEDGGVTFDPPIKLGAFAGAEKAGPGGAMLLSEITVGKWKDGQRAYLLYPHKRQGKPAVFDLVTSDDNGKTWSEPRLVDVNAPAGWGSGSCSIMTNAEGVVGIQWYSIKSNKFDIYFTASVDGGDTFAKPVRVSTATSKEPPKQPRTPGQDQVYGDTAADGTFRLVWTDAREGAKTYTVYTRTATVKKE